MNINQILLTIADEIARENGYIMIDEKLIIGKNDWFWGNRKAWPNAQVLARTYILPAWEDEQERQDYSTNKVYLDMHWGNPRIHVRYPDGISCCLTYRNTDNSCSEVQAFGSTGLTKASYIQNKINELNNKDHNK